MQELIQTVLRKSGISMRVGGVGIGSAVRRLMALAAVAIGLQAAPTMAQTVYFHNDSAGSPIAATDATGNLLWKESYRPYGERMLKPAAANTQWFHGKQLDPDTGLEDFGARNYDPVLGRFLSIDPVDFQDKNIHTFNRYAYGANNPLRYKDPDGRHFAAILGGQTAAEGGLIVGGGYKPSSMGSSSPPPLEAQLQSGNANPGYAPAPLDLFKPIRGYLAIFQALGDFMVNSLLDQARAARDELAMQWHEKSGWKPAAITAGYNIKTGEVAARACGDGKCAEDHVVEALGGVKADVRFTEATRPRLFPQEQPVCNRCEGSYGRESFPPGTQFKSDSTE